jgi:PAS domain S-box-containing protein
MQEIELGPAGREPYFMAAEAALEGLERAIHENRAASVAACAAALESASVSAGAGLVAPIAAELERRARACDLSVAAHLLAALERALVQTEAACQAPVPAMLIGSPSKSPASAPDQWDSRPLSSLRDHSRNRAPSEPSGSGGPGGPLGPWRPRTRWSAWIPLAVLLAVFVVLTRVLSPNNLSGLTTYAAAGVLALALVRLGMTLIEDRRTVASIRSMLHLMQASELQLALLFEHSPQPMWVYDRETLQILVVSNAAIASYGYSREEFLAMKITDLRPREELPSLFEFLDGAHGPERLGFSAADPWRHTRKDSSVMEVEISSDDLFFGGRECRIVVSQDVTERNRASAELALARDEAVEASNLKSAFLATMSHEMRTPMQGVIGMNEMLLATALTAEQRRYAEQVARSGEQMLAIVEDVLDISSLESGEHVPTVEGFDLHQTLARACSPARLAADAKRLRFDLVIGSEVPRLVLGDRDMLRRAISQLVSNAVKFSDEGLVVVRVGACLRGPEREHVIRVAVSDTGIGMEGESLERMFEPFVQADRSTTRQYGGVGLGLAIARELVALMGGVLCAESEPWRGSTFWFELSLPEAVAGEHAQRPPSRRRMAPRGARTPLVLVAEDSHINQIAAVRALRRYGCLVDVVGDGDEALQALALKHYDAVLMDCNMPRVDGYEATARLRRGEHGRHTPVIAMTAHERGGDEARCLGAGMDAAISKPLHPEALRETLARWIPAFAEAGDDGAASPPLRHTLAG